MRYDGVAGYVACRAVGSSEEQASVFAAMYEGAHAAGGAKGRDAPRAEGGARGEEEVRQLVAKKARLEVLLRQ
eukprot:2946963-Prymnesium_polylepis.1